VIFISWPEFDKIQIPCASDLNLSVMLNLDQLGKIIKQWKQNVALYINWTDPVKFIFEDFPNESYVVPQLIE
jgi:hypothetical protein